MHLPVPALFMLYYVDIRLCFLLFCLLSNFTVYLLFVLPFLCWCLCLTLVEGSRIMCCSICLEIFMPVPFFLWRTSCKIMVLISFHCILQPCPWMMTAWSPWAWHFAQSGTWVARRRREVANSLEIMYHLSFCYTSNCHSVRAGLFKCRVREDAWTSRRWDIRNGNLGPFASEILCQVPKSARLVSHADQLDVMGTPVRYEK